MSHLLTYLHQHPKDVAAVLFFALLIVLLLINRIPRGNCRRCRNLPGSPICRLYCGEGRDE